MYSTVWASLVRFAAGAIGERGGRPWAWRAWAGGVALMAVHIALAMGLVHGWSHAAAIAATARATDAVFGLDWGGGVYVNYVFVTVWALDTVWWRLRPADRARRPAAVTWALRIFYVVVIVNAAVVFAAGWRRLIGAFIVATLALAWSRPHLARQRPHLTR
jgi:hypothetical protein